MTSVPPQEVPKLLWNTESVKDVAESVGIASLNEDALRTLSQDVEYRIGQVIVEALRFMRAANRTTLTVQDVSQAMKVLDVEPLYGYDSTRPLRYGEASLGPGQPLFYIEDEEVDFEKLINAPLPKVPRDMSFTAHWLAIEGVQPAIPQNPTSAETSSKELLPKGPGANPALAALAGNDNVSFRPAVKHVISKELILYFDKIQAAILDEDPDEEKSRFRAAALESVRSDPGLHQLLPYFVTFVTNQVTHRMDDTFVLRQMMELTEAIIANPHMFLEPYASALSVPVLTCLMSRRLGGGGGATGEDEMEGLVEQYKLRELAASLLGTIAKKYSRGNSLLRPKLTRTCLKYFLDPSKSPAVLFGAVKGLAEVGGPEAVRVLLTPNLKHFDEAILKPLREKNGGGLELEALTGGIMSALWSLCNGPREALESRTGPETSEATRNELVEFVGEVVGDLIARGRKEALIKAVLEARAFE
ncbi:hypothetical protein GE09DRAFT_1159017 [Coniochaeta sp. 2T2.1]|nr:hypothetical protein GE09DRAFT_1159017 [Coniochaeta sp. 2T2.1]